MAKITIKLNINENNDINITNTDTGKKIEIKYSERKLNAKDVYDIFDYKKGNEFEIESDINEINQAEKIKNYYKPVIEIFEEIKNKLNELNISDGK